MVLGNSRRSAGPSASHSHDHEWECYGGSDSFVHEDFALHVHEDCSYAEVTGSATSERHDETFYEYGYECDATRRHRFEIVRIERVNADGEVAETLADGRDEVEGVSDLPMAAIEQRAAERLAEASGSRPKPPERGGPAALAWEVRLGEWDDGPHTIDVLPDIEDASSPLRLTYERRDVEVYHV
jgi:hypothetical protein